MNAAGPPTACAPIEVPAAGARLWAVWSSVGLQRLCWAPPEGDAALALGPSPPPQALLPEPYAGVLSSYLAGGDVDPVELPVDLRGTAFQLQVWQALRRIPRGAVRSYQGIANDIGSPRAMRAVGAANGRNPVAVVVPCHRVVTAGMRLGGYNGGLPLKRFLLRLEGVDIRADEVRAGQLGFRSEGFTASDDESLP